MAASFKQHFILSLIYFCCILQKVLVHDRLEVKTMTPWSFLTDHSGSAVPYPFPRTPLGCSPMAVVL